MILTYRFRVKDGSAGKRLNRHAKAANLVWNYCCEIQRRAQDKWTAGLPTKWPTAFDLINLCSGSSVELGVNSDTIQTICRQFVASRTTHRQCPRFRASGGAKRSLGWVPFTSRSIKIDGATATYVKRKYAFWKSRQIKNIKAGCFAQDARGRWYVCFQCEIPENLPTEPGIIGIDLGLKSLATLSDGTGIEAPKHFRKYEEKLATAQRAGNRRHAKAIHAKIANSRKDFLHKASTKIARENELIVVGNVNAAALGQTRMAKSVYDAGWSMFRNMLRYKASRHGARYIEADERWTSATCSACGVRSGPKGIAGLQIRHWVCSDCGESHDRDVNAAKNILRVGLERQALVGEAPSLSGGDVNAGCDTISARIRELVNNNHTNRNTM